MSTFNRRAVLAGAATAAVVVQPGAVRIANAKPVDLGVGDGAAPSSPDDTLARIGEHRRLMRAICGICERQNELEEMLPEERRKFCMINHRGTDIGKDDDPRWTANQQEYWAVADAIDEIAWSFCDRPATSIEGVRAILAYAVEYEESGYEWPDSRHHYSVDGTYAGHAEEDWRKSLLRALAEVRS